jgi:hypothetical protein
MITLTPDKLAGRGRGSPQEIRSTEGSTPKRITLPESLGPLGKAGQGHASLYSMTGQDDACQHALFPRLSAIIRMLMQGEAHPLHVTPTTKIVATKQAKMAASQRSLLSSRHRWTRAER